MKLGRLAASMGILALIGAMMAAPAGARVDAGAMPAARTNVRIDVHGHGVSGTTSRYRSSLQAPRTSARPASATSPPSGTTAPTPSAPVSLLGFAGIPDLGLFSPSDTTGALGATFFVTAVNTEYAVWHLDGTQALAPTDLDTIETATNGLDLFDPKVVYDPYNDTFVLAYLAQRDAPRGSFIVLVAIPDATADQTSTWCPTAIPGDEITTDAEQWADYPALGFDGDRVVVSTNQFTFPSSHGSFSYAQLISFPKTSLYDCSQPLTGTAFAGTKTQNQDGSRAFTIQPAQTVGATATRQFMLSFEGPGRDSYLTVWRLTQAATGLKLKKGTIFTGKVKPAPPGTQGGGSLTDGDTFWDPGDLRLINAFYDSDRNGLYAAHPVFKNLGPDTVTGGYPESVVRWYEVLPAGRLGDSVLSRKGTVGQAETDAGWPAVATDDAGNLFVTYNRASEPLGEFISAWAAEIAPGSTTAVSTLLVAGTAVHDSLNGLERWGDFNGINRDPVHPSYIAMVNQVAIAGSRWQQTVNVVTHG